MIDGGEPDEKIIAVPLDDPNYKHYYDIKELPKHIFQPRLFIELVFCLTALRYFYQRFELVFSPFRLTTLTINTITILKNCPNIFLTK